MNWFDLFILIVVAYCALSGYKSGLIRQLASLVGFATAAILSGQISTIIEPHIKKASNIPEYLVDSLSYALSFLVIMIFFYILGRMLESIVKSIKMGTLNRIGGSVLCLAKWVLVVSIILNIIIRIDNKKQLTNNIEKDSISYRYIQPIAPSIIPYLQFNFEQKLGLIL